MTFALSTFGWTVIGPFASNAAAMEAVDSQVFSAAVLDLDLGEALSVPTAMLLREREIPFLFMTGHDAAAVIPDEFQGERCLVKPVEPEQLVEALEALASRS